MRIDVAKGRLWPILLLVVIAMGLRLGRLAWQPLWADEGYSIYFATEPLARMLWLTANDIHPPLYYALLHSWTAMLSTTGPMLLRLFSVLLAVPAVALLALLARALFPGRPRLVLLATLLLAFNPMHLFYSQEVRMYGLAMTLSLASTFTFWQAMTGPPARRRVWWITYIIAATATLYTLYYSAFLLLAHLIWALWQERRRWYKLRPLLGAELLIALLYAPWVVYTAATLATYVEDKVGADQDHPLGPLEYITRHLLTFLAGHLTLPAWPSFWRWAALLGLLLMAIALLLHRRRPAPSLRGNLSTAASRALWIFVLLPAAIAFLINRFLPFFPDGGERLLLFLLPYLLLLIAAALDSTWWQWHLGKGALALLLLSAGGGITTFYRLPRYVADDYRPLVRQVVQQGNDEDTLLATFPWQVGLWRAYAPAAGLPLDSIHGPQIELAGERTVTWGKPLQDTLARGLAQGTLWFPGLRSIGSTLPAAVDQFLAEQPPPNRPVLLVDHWYGNTTLRAWHQLAATPTTPTVVDFGPIQLRGVGVTPTTAAAANMPIRIDLQWNAPVDAPMDDSADGSVDAHYGMTIRLLRDGQQWANHDLDRLADVTGLIVPAGLPPGAYEVQLGVVDGAGDLLTTTNADHEPRELVALATITITTPAAPPSAARLPMRVSLTPPVVLDGLTLLGYSTGEDLPLAGEFLTVTLFWANGVNAAPRRDLYVSLLDQAGNGVAGWEGWPLPDYPMTAWPAGALVQTPVRFTLPPTLTSGSYQLGAGLLDPASGNKSPMIRLGEQAIRQRTINYEAKAPPLPLTPPVQFGTHVRLLGYALERHDRTLTIQLYWQVLQPLLPPHHIFVHLDAADGQTLAQSDDVPRTVDGPAPTGSWLPGEYLVTEQTIVAPVLDSTTSATALVLRIGLYVPETGLRLPITNDGAITGDHVTIPLQP